MTYIMSCVWLDYMVQYFQCKNCVGSSLKTKKCVASFLVPGDTTPGGPKGPPGVSRFCLRQPVFPANAKKRLTKSMLQVV